MGVCKRGPLLHICPCPGLCSVTPQLLPLRGTGSFIDFQTWACLGTLLGLQTWHRWWSAGSQPKVSQRLTGFYSRSAPAMRTHLRRDCGLRESTGELRHPSWPIADHRDMRDPNSEDGPSRVQSQGLTHGIITVYLALILSYWVGLLCYTAVTICYTSSFHLITLLSPSKGLMFCKKFWSKKQETQILVLTLRYYFSEYQFPCLYDNIQDASNWSIFMKETDKAA